MFASGDPTHQKRICNGFVHTNAVLIGLFLSQRDQNTNQHNDLESFESSLMQAFLITVCTFAMRMGSKAVTVRRSGQQRCEKCASKKTPKIVSKVKPAES